MTPKERSRIFYLNHRDEIIARTREWEINNPEKAKRNKDKKEYKLKALERAKAWRIKNPERDRVLKNKWAASHREFLRAKSRKRHKEHPEYFSRYAREKNKTNLQFHIKGNLRSRLYSAIKWEAKSGSAVRDLGCTVDELKFYLEGQFQDGMTWETWSLSGWHIDHKIPLDFFDLTDKEQLLKAVHYTNLQPMWARENLSKGNKLPIKKI